MFLQSCAVNILWMGVKKHVLCTGCTGIHPSIWQMLGYSLHELLNSNRSSKIAQLTAFPVILQLE